MQSSSVGSSADLVSSMCAGAEFAIENFTCDFYLSDPVDGLDAVYNGFRQRPVLVQVPILRIFGSLLSGDCFIQLRRIFSNFSVTFSLSIRHAKCSTSKSKKTQRFWLLKKQWFQKVKNGLFKGVRFLLSFNLSFEIFMVVPKRQPKRIGRFKVLFARSRAISLPARTLSFQRGAIVGLSPTSRRHSR